MTNFENDTFRIDYRDAKGVCFHAETRTGNFDRIRQDALDFCISGETCEICQGDKILFRQTKGTNEAPTGEKVAVYSITYRKCGKVIEQSPYSGTKEQMLDYVSDTLYGPHEMATVKGDDGSIYELFKQTPTPDERAEVFVLREEGMPR